MSRTDPDAARRAARREVARRLHPDRGGDVGAYLAALAAVDRAHALPTSTTSTRRPRLGRRLRLVSRAVRARLPRGVPGSRRWARL